MTRAPEFIAETLRTLWESGGLRILAAHQCGHDFHSNDYLGLARTDFDPEAWSSWLGERGGSIGCTGSRLISGNSEAIEELEAFLATFHSAESALLFNSGFEANTAVVGALGVRGATVLYDQHIHASMREGLRVGYAKHFSFKHNDLEDLEERLRRVAKGETYVFVESLYSMDGDHAPLVELVEMSERLGFYLVVDEAHATGVYGPQGGGVVQSLGLQHRVLARVHTFGKAVGFRGGCVVGSQELRQFLINTARPFMYSTGPDLFSVYWTRMLYERMIGAVHERTALRNRIQHLTARLKTVEELAIRVLSFNSPIHAVLVPGNHQVMALERELLQEGFLVKGIRSPTVPKGTERIRISVHSFNSEESVQGLCAKVTSFFTRGTTKGFS